MDFVFVLRVILFNSRYSNLVTRFVLHYINYKPLLYTYIHTYIGIRTTTIYKNTWYVNVLI